MVVENAVSSTTPEYPKSVQLGWDLVTDTHTHPLKPLCSFDSPLSKSQIKCIYIALLTSADISKCCRETQPKTPNSKQCRCRSTVARKNSLERSKPRKKPREEPGYEGWPVLIWLCQAEITEHGHNVHKWPAWSNNNNHSSCRGCSKSSPQE